jgi:sterol desaturase/sphingolipid hydroxylase (fatty acid hydroxylase superfamily)
VAAASDIAFSIAAVWILEPAADWAIGFVERWYDAVQEAPWWIVVPAYVLVADCGAYFAHRALHTRWLWPTHAWHHSSTHLYWLSGLRGSPVDVLVLNVPYFAAFVVLPTPETGSVAVGMAVLDVVNQHLIHSNIHVPYARQIERVLVTPRYHFVHHDVRPHVGNSNYGFIFSVWDRVFGTYTNPDSVAKDAPLGLARRPSRWRLLLGLPGPAERVLGE